MNMIEPNLYRSVRAASPATNHATDHGMDRALDTSASATASGRSIGAILIDAGRLSAKGAEQILRLQRTVGIRFGDAALQLGLLTIDDIRFALASQFDYPYLSAADDSLSRELIAAYQPFSPAVEQLRALRSQLMLRLLDAESLQSLPSRACNRRRKALAIVSPGAGEGRSFIAANLAIVFSQLGERTLLIDADLRAPCQHELFKLTPGAGLSGLLAGRGGAGCVTRIPSLLGLSLLPAGVVPPNPQELLGRPAFAEIVQRLSAEYDVVLIDTPAASDYADAQTIAARAGAALVVARSSRSAFGDLSGLAQNFHQSGIKLVGSVMNDLAAGFR